MKRDRILRGLKFLLFVLLAATVFSFVVMWLWNWLMPATFSLHTISFWQALGLLVLSKILFGGFRGRPGLGGDWRMRLIQRWEQMTPEEQDKFRAGMRRGCGPFGSSPAPPAASAPRE
jgi:lipopolysaccharide export LptBFGC system permease protein LptF